MHQTRASPGYARGRAGPRRRGQDSRCGRSNRVVVGLSCDRADPLARDSDAVLARFPTVHTDAENATAAAFRSGEASILNGGKGLTGAVVVPLMASSGCVGVLALEFQHGAEQHQSVRAFATIVAAQLVTLFGPVPLAEAVDAERHGRSIPKLRWPVGGRH